MHSITVTTIDEQTFEVAVTGRSTTTHIVIASPEYVEKLTGRQTEAKELVSRSFEFLLEREPNTSILRRFELPVIARYFPEYEHVIREMLPNKS